MDAPHGLVSENWTVGGKSGGVEMLFVYCEKSVIHPHPAFGHLLPHREKEIGAVPCIRSIPWFGVRLAKCSGLALDGDVQVAVDFFEALVVPELGEVESRAEEEDA